MSALGLVAYDGSGSSSEDEDETMSDMTGNQGLQTPTVTVVNGGPSSNQKSSGGVSVPSVKSSVIFSKFIDDEEDEDVTEPNVASKLSGGISDDEDALVKTESGANPIWSSFLPQPKKVTAEVVGDGDVVEIGPIPPKKTYGDEELPQPPKPSSIPSLSSTKVKGKVRISIPFLNSLEEEEPIEDGDKKKLMQPSQKGSGLFALLPQPKNNFGSFTGDSNNVFLKNKSANTKPSATSVQSSSVTKTSQDPQPQSSSSMSRLIPDSVKNKLKRPAPSKLDEIRAKLSKKGHASATASKAKDSDSDDDDAGDFFSLDSAETIDPEALEKLKLPMQNFDRVPEVTNHEAMDVEEHQGYQESTAGSSSSRPEDLMKFIQPKKGRKEEVKIIDINADDLRPDNTEWLKNITDESQAPARKSKGLGGMVKRKHQITYLAFEAKAREQELKNQWAQNRANKMATNNKYGF